MPFRPFPRLAAAALVSLALAVPAGFFAVSSLVVGGHGEGRIYKNADEVPRLEAALVLGTSKYVSPGRPNRFYEARIRAAAELYRKGRVRGIVVSGDNSTLSYNEPQRMKEDLVALGVPPLHVTCDYAGRRTLDSVIRMKEIFGLDRYVIVTQEFHLRRALYIADAHGHDAVGFAAEGDAGGLKIRFREMLARVLAFLDVTILERGAKFLGDRVPVTLREPDPASPER